jgi:tRNA (adenine22-N1)-methyltransferase
LLAGSKPTLSARLEAILSLLEPCHSLADIATDHALLPIAAVARGLCERAVAIDLREAPLVEARRNVERAGLGERIALLRGDGLLPLLSQPTEAVVIAGVSGALVVRMLEAVQSLKSGLNQLVLQPNTDLAQVRAWARKNGLHLRAERSVLVRGRFFAACAYQPGEGDDPAYRVPGFSLEQLDSVGPRLLAERSEATLRQAEAQCERLSALRQHGPHHAEELASWELARRFLRGAG